MTRHDVKKFNTTYVWSAADASKDLLIGKLVALALQFWRLSCPQQHLLKPPLWGDGIYTKP